MTGVAASRRIPRTALALGLSATLPFVILAAVQWLGVPAVSPAAVSRTALSYGALVLAFLGGIRWGTAMGPFGTLRQSLDFAASILAIAAAAAALALPEIPGLALLAAGFLTQALWDVLSVEAGRLPQWFGKLRMIVTAGAVLSLLAVLLRLLI